MILRLVSGDIIEHLAETYYWHYRDEVDERELEPIKLGHILSGTYGCIIGLVGAILAFIMELLKKPQKQTNNIVLVQAIRY